MDNRVHLSTCMMNPLGTHYRIPLYHCRVSQQHAMHNLLVVALQKVHGHFNPELWLSQLHV